MTTIGNGDIINSDSGSDSAGTIRGDGADISSGYSASLTGTMRTNANEILSGISRQADTIKSIGPAISAGTGHSHAAISSNEAAETGDSLILNNLTYKYLSVLSKSSGEAEVFLLSREGKKCVFKLYYPNFKPNEEILKNLVQLNHEDIINVLDYGYYRDRFFEIMDYAEGGTLDQYLPIKDIKRIRQIVSETVNSFLYCHQLGIIHKDIKPQNMYFKNSDGTDLVIGDFGISSILDSGVSRHLTSQSLTVGYAAPEMYGIGGKVYVGREVDYYALGISLIHIWEGKSPFEGLGIHAISNLTTSSAVHIPTDNVPVEVQKLIKGLITLDYTKRWGYDEVLRWLNGEDVPIHFHSHQINYPPYQFGQLDGQNKVANTPEELSTLMKNHPERGKKQLYGHKISAWINLFNQGLSSDIDSIVEDDYPKHQNAGLQKAIYILNPDEGFESINGSSCHTSEELGDALEANSTQYMRELTEPTHPFYLFLDTHEAKKESDIFKNYFNTFSAYKAINKIILELQGREALKLHNEWYTSPEDLLHCPQIVAVISNLEDLESKVSLWIDGLSDAVIKDQVNKWRNLDRHDKTTLAYALEKGSPFHFPNGDCAFDISEFEKLFCKYIQQDNFKLTSVWDASQFNRDVNYWIDNYHNIYHDNYFNDFFIVKSINNTLGSTKKGVLLLLDYFNCNIDRQFYNVHLHPIIKNAITNNIISEDELKECGNNDYLSTWFMRWQFIADIGFKFGDDIAYLPKELAALIDRDQNSWALGISLLKNDWIKTWLEAIGYLKDISSFTNAMSSSDWHNNLESVLHIIDPDLPWPKPIATPSNIELGRISNGSEATILLILKNSGRGYLYGSASLNNTNDSIELIQNTFVPNVNEIIIAGETTINVVAKPNKLSAWSKQKETITAKMNGVTIGIPVSYTVDVPIKKMAAKSLIFGTILGIILGFYRYILASKYPFLVPWTTKSLYDRVIITNATDLPIFVVFAIGLIAIIVVYVKYLNNISKKRLKTIPCSSVEKMDVSV